MDEKYAAAAIRRTWDAIAGRAFEEAGEVRMTADKVRRFISDYIESEAEGSTSRWKFWASLAAEDKRRILELAFPKGSYTRPEKGSVFTAAPASVETSKLREMLEDRGFDPFTLEDAEAGGRSISDLIADSIDRADLVLVVVPHHGTRNPNVFIELGYALAKKKRILALVPPDEELPFSAAPYLRTELDNQEAIGFGVDQVLAAPKGKSKGKGKSRNRGIKKTKPLGAAADRLLVEVRANGGQITETKFMDIVRRAIEESGVSTIVSKPAGATRRVDFAVWSDDLEPLIKNPVVIELKSRLRGREHFEETIAQLARALDVTHTQLGLLIYAASDGDIDEEAVHDPRILVMVDPLNWTTRDVKLIEGLCSIPRCVMARHTKKRHPAAFKARVALEAAKQTRTLAELAQGLPGPPRPDQPVEEATPGRHRVPVPRRPPPRARREPGHPGRTLRADRPAQHGGRVVEKKSCPLRLTSSGPWSNPIILI